MFYLFWEHFEVRFSAKPWKEEQVNKLQLTGANIWPSFVKHLRGNHYGPESIKNTVYYGLSRKRQTFSENLLFSSGYLLQSRITFFVCQTAAAPWLSVIDRILPLSICSTVLSHRICYTFLTGRLNERLTYNSIRNELNQVQIVIWKQAMNHFLQLGVQKPPCRNQNS